MKKYFHSDDLDYGIGVYNEETESMDYDNNIDVPNGEYPVFEYVFVDKKPIFKRKSFVFAGEAKIPSMTFIGKTEPAKTQYVYEATAKEKLVVVDGKFDAEQLSRIASDIKKKIKYHGCYLDNITPQVTSEGKFTGKLQVSIGS